MFDFSLLDSVIEKYKSTPGSLISILQEAQGIYGYSKDILDYIAGE